MSRSDDMLYYSNSKTVTTLLPVHLVYYI